MDRPELTDKTIRLFISTLKEYSKKINIISKGITEEQLNALIEETILLEKHISESTIVDAGSGNGILGIPIAIINPDKKIFLIEPRKKKSEFLSYVIKKLDLKNTEVIRSGIEEFLKGRQKRKFTMIARGFPDNIKLVIYVKKKIVKELLLITSLDKIKKMTKGIEKLRQNIYNVPFRDNLKIIHIANVSRET
ncbi:MAG: class I SAM-dependent methyltransferase [Candidatus Aminicenantes bacterium]|nr:class I SAM-dependent methyltransferase [Candidatus Aminicenantes bacterium]MCK5005222.1 class I SAM-dependent methyltransferase [Candidatus Aminicenantes bacterium]